MKEALRARGLKLIAEEMKGYRVARFSHNHEEAWTALERAHILSQPYLGPHLANHIAMLRFAVHLRDWREAAGQILRLALAPLGAVTRRLPRGNTGRSNVSAFQPMPIAEDLLAKMNRVSK